MKLREHVPLAPLTTLGVGGAARFFVEADTEEDIREALLFTAARQLPLFVMGAAAIAIGAGFFISSFMAYGLSRRLGLFPTQPAAPDSGTGPTQ